MTRTEPAVINDWEFRSHEAAFVLVESGAFDHAEVRNYPDRELLFEVHRTSLRGISWRSATMPAPAFEYLDDPIAPRESDSVLWAAERRRRGQCALMGGWCITHSAQDTAAHHFATHQGAFND